jgi:acetyltransferase-like isoleucine patch superfamily enzyme
MTIQEILQRYALYVPHLEVHAGQCSVGHDTVISQHSKIDLTGSVDIGNYCMIGDGAWILTHDHYHEGREPLLLLQKEKGVKWQDKVIEDDVWIHCAVILYQVTRIPKGTVIGAGSILTKNPDVEYGIWGGNPATLIGMR